MTRNYFNELVESHKTANDLEKTAYYIHYREFNSCLSQIHGVEGDESWNKLMELFNSGDVEITDMCLYSDELANAYTLPDLNGWNFSDLQPIDFEDDNYVHINVPFISIRGNFTTTK